MEFAGELAVVIALEPIVVTESTSDGRDTVSDGLVVRADRKVHGR
jgi:hypothetical protein